MNVFRSATCLCLLSIALASAQATVEKTKKLSHKDSLSYAIGIQFARSIAVVKDSLEQEMIIRAIRDKFSGKTELVEPDKINVQLMAFKKIVMDKTQKDALKEIEKNRAAGRMFLEQNRKKPGVFVSGSGLQYIVMKEGIGLTPKLTDGVKVNYKSCLIDGTVVEESATNGGPKVVPVSKTLKGWQEALLTMKVGSKYKLFIPADLALGNTVMGGNVRPGSTLIFDLELLSIEK